MKHVGEAVKEQQITYGSEDRVNVIGIASWGIVDRKDSLIAPRVRKAASCFEVNVTQVIHTAAVLVAMATLEK